MQHTAVRNRSPSQRGAAFTLIDLMLVLAVLGIVTLLALPSVDSDQPLKIVGAAAILASDIEFAQSETLAVPADPTEVHLDSANGRYWLARASDPNTPIEHPGVDASGTSDPYDIRYGQGEYGYLAGVQIELIGGSGSGTLAFDPFGRLNQSGDARIRLSNDSGDLFVVVTASTGSVAIEE